jgi:DMSO/TMAO reductase YedYZ molybdopterin-dependent catalytic subunit
MSTDRMRKDDMTKLGFKNPEYVVAMEVTNTDHGGYWENQGYNWFGGL